MAYDAGMAIAKYSACEHGVSTLTGGASSGNGSRKAVCGSVHQPELLDWNPISSKHGRASFYILHMFVCGLAWAYIRTR